MESRFPTKLVTATGFSVFPSRAGFGLLPAAARAFAACFLALVQAPADAGEIRTIAGTGIPGHSGDGLTSVLAQLKFPESLALARNGDLYIADQGNFCVRRISAKTGIIATAAGSGRGGFSGDGGPARSARLLAPSALSLNRAGDLFIADTGNDRIRMVSAHGETIATIAGNGHWGFGGDGIPAVQAALANPSGICGDSEGNLYVADMWHHRVRMISAANGLISTVAGNGRNGYRGDGGPAVEARLSSPHGLAMAENGDLYVADMWAHCVRMIDSKTGTISTVAGTGTPGYNGDGIPAAEAKLNGPHSVCIDSAGNLFIADKENHRVRRVDASTGLIGTVAGAGQPGFGGDFSEAANALLRYPEGVLLDGRDLLIADTGNHRVRRVAGAGD